MSKRSLYIFVEGKTEERLLKIMGCPVKPDVCGSKDSICDTMQNKLSDELGDHPTGILILRDRDYDESLDDIAKSFNGVINGLLPDLKTSHKPFQPHDNFGNIYTMKVKDANFRAALHIAAPPSVERVEIVSDTIDGYILALAMNEMVMARFAKKAKITPKNINPEDALRWAVCKGVAEVADKAKITFDQAKDFLGVYMAMSRFLTKGRSEEDDVFSSVVVNRAKKYANDEFQDVFRSISTALEFLEDDV